MSEHKALIAIVGPSGSGKSTSLRNLNPDTTVILDGERKGFPFRGSNKFRILPFANPAEHDSQFQLALKTPNVELIVVDSLTKRFEQIKELCQKCYKGFEIYGQYSKMVQATLNQYKNDKCAVAVTSIDDIVELVNVDGSTTNKRMMAVDGKEQRGKIEKEFLLVLFTEPRRNKAGAMEYWFQTNTDGSTTAKTPLEMFTDQLVPNDLAAVIARAKSYYNGEPKTT